MENVVTLRRSFYWEIEFPKPISRKGLPGDLSNKPAAWQMPYQEKVA